LVRYSVRRRCRTRPQGSYSPAPSPWPKASTPVSKPDGGFPQLPQHTPWIIRGSEGPGPTRPKKPFDPEAPTDSRTLSPRRRPAAQFHPRAVRCFDVRRRSLGGQTANGTVLSQFWVLLESSEPTKKSARTQPSILRLRLIPPGDPSRAEPVRAIDGTLMPPKTPPANSLFSDGPNVRGAIPRLGSGPIKFRLRRPWAYRRRRLLTVLIVRGAFVLGAQVCCPDHRQGRRCAGRRRGACSRGS